MKAKKHYWEMSMLKVLYSMGGTAHYTDVFHAMRYQFPMSETQLTEHSGKPNYYRIAGFIRKNLYMSGLIEEPRDHDGILRVTDRGWILIERFIEFENMLYSFEVLEHQNFDVSSLLERV